MSPPFLAEILAAFGPGEESPGEVSSHAGLLTNRELEVLQLLAKRYTDKEIADALVISTKTVNSHVEHLADKLGVRGRRAIVEAARAQGLLT